MKQRRNEPRRTGGKKKSGETRKPLYRFWTEDRERISDRERIGEIIKEKTMRRKSPFVREVKRMERRESWRKKHVRKEANRTGGDTASDEQAQSSKAAEEVKKEKKTEKAKA